MRLVGYRTAEGGGIGRLDSESKLVPLGGVEQFWADRRTSWTSAS
jgi:hypothetical protein